MTVTLTYDNVLSRVRVTATGLGAADYATVERSTDGLRWTTVRAGMQVPVSAGTMLLTVDDYEFVDGVANTYRVRGVANSPVGYVGAGSASTAVNASVTPGLPASTTTDDLVLVHVSIRNSGAGVPVLPANWSTVVAFGNEAIFGRIYDGVWTMPSVSFTGGVAGADTIGQSAAFRRTSLTPLSSAATGNVSQQNIPYPALNPPEAGCVLIVAGWKQDDWLSVSVPAGFTNITSTAVTAGNDAAQTWDYQIQTTPVNLPTGSLAVSGGVSAVSNGVVVALPHADWINTQTAQITPQLGAIWLKDIGRPYLNRPVTVVAPEDNPVTRAARDGVFDVVGRSLPVVVTDVRGPRQWQMLLRTATVDEATAVDLVLSTGDVMLVHTPAGCQILGGYVRIGNTSQTWHPLHPEQSFFTLPLTAAAAPGPDVVGSTSTWQTVLNTYGSWSAVLAANATWSSLLNLIGSPSEVIVP
jgi:hypothetical protein